MCFSNKTVEYSWYVDKRVLIKTCFIMRQSFLDKIEYSVKTWCLLSLRVNNVHVLNPEVQPKFLWLATDFLIDGRRIGCLEGPRITTGGLELGTQITPWGWIFWTIIFYHQKIQVKIYLMRGQTLLWVY